MKVVFIQNIGGTYGGVWQVNKMISEGLIKEGYEVQIISIRKSDNYSLLEHDKRLKVITINEKDSWTTYHVEDLKESLKTGKILEAFKGLYKRIKNDIQLKKDAKELNNYLDNYKPNYIITSHYQILDLLDKKFYPMTFHEQHSNFRDFWNHLGTREVLLKYKDKVKYIWLCKKTMNVAIEHGLKNSLCIYNSVRFETKEKANSIKNKKLVTIARLSREKRIDKMVHIAEEVFKDKKYDDWNLEIWGDGEEYDYIKSLIKTSKIKLMGKTNNPKNVFLTSSINLITSDYEGFALSILEANECGVPTIAFDFGESTDEEILDGKTGFIAKDSDDYIKKLKELMDNSNLLEELSINAKKYNENFRIGKIIEDWKKILK